MNKILVTIYVLSLGVEYDMLIPINIVVKEAIELIQNGIVDLAGDEYLVNLDAFLYDEKGKIINSNNIVKFSGLRNGSKVMIV